MTREEIMTLNIEEIEARGAEILEEIKVADAEGLDTLQAELDAIEERKAAIKAEIEERAKKMSEVIKGAGEPIEAGPKEERKMDNIEIRKTKEYENAYANYIKTNDDTECRALLSENASGKVPVPELVEGLVRTAWEKEGIMSRVRKSYLRGNVKVSFEISGTAADIHTEGSGAVTEETLVLGIVDMTPESIKKWISISDEALDLTGADFLMYIYDELAYRIAKKAADEMIAKIEACGTVSTTTCPGVPVITASAVAVGTVAQAMANLSDQASDPVVIMNKATWGEFKAAQYANKFNVDPFEGLPVVFNNTITAFGSATTGDTYAIVGDLNYGALANFPNGEEITFKYDELTLATSDLVKIIGREFVALGVVAPNAFVKIQK